MILEVAGYLDISARNVNSYMIQRRVVFMVPVDVESTVERVWKCVMSPCSPDLLVICDNISIKLYRCASLLPDKSP